MGNSFQNFRMPLIFLVTLLLPVFFCHLIPDVVRSSLYAVSLSIKELLIFSLPFIIFSLVFNSITKIGTKALGYAVVIVSLVYISNFTNTMLSYGVSSIISTFEAGLKTTHTNGGSNLQPNFILSIPKIISNDIALVFGVLSGFIVGLFKNGTAIKMSVVLDKFTKLFFKVLIPLMPLFIVGTAVKLQQDGILTSIVEKYLPILCIFLFAACGAITVQLVVLAKFRIGKVLEYIKNTLPAMITALGSMSSAAALPLSIEAAEKNLQDKTNAGIIVPSVVNIHLVGDCFFIPMIAIAVMVSFNLDFPDISKYLLFAVHFVIAKFAVAAVPGGGVLVMLPIMQKYLGLSADMLALVTALYVLFDPLITMCNVAGNASMAIAFDKVVGRMTKR